MSKLPVLTLLMVVTQVGASSSMGPAQEQNTPEPPPDHAQTLPTTAEAPVTLPSAEQFCPPLRTVLDSATHAFQDIRGKGDRETGWDTSLKLPGLSRCAIASDTDSGPTYSCMLQSRSTPESSHSDFNSVKRLIASCLGTDWREGREHFVPGILLYMLFTRPGYPYVHLELHAPSYSSDLWKLRLAVPARAD